jgi:methylated-DNA-[protein]-cysteine S-methyltransferase
MLLDERIPEMASDQDTGSGIDAAFRIFSSPIGSLLVAASDHGITRIAFESEGHDSVVLGLGIVPGSGPKASEALLDEAEEQLGEYFSGRRTAFDLALDERVSQGFRSDVLRHLREIPYGETESYGDVAMAVGRPKASRAAGTACATNPWPIVVPCHRVVRSDGTIGSYLAGPAAKRLLLDLERAQ